MIYGYARVSTGGQARYGNGSKIQENNLKAAGCEIIYKEIAPGSTMERPVLQELLERLKEGDTIVVTRLDRLTRSTKDGNGLFDEFAIRGITLKALDIGTIAPSPAGKFISSIMFMFAEFERDFVNEMTHTALKEAKESNPELAVGRKKRQIDEEKFAFYREKVRKGEMTVTECCKAFGISRTLWYSRIKEVA